MHIRNLKFKPIIVNQEVWIGLLIGNAKIWKQGVGSDGLDYVIKIAHIQFNVKVLYLRVHRNNLPAITLYLNSGFVMDTKKKNNSEDYLML